MNKKTNSGLKIICLNRKASFNYFFEDLFEAGIVLKGSEIKSVRDGKVNIADSYAVEKNGEIILINSHIAGGAALRACRRAKQSQDQKGRHDPDRPRARVLLLRLRYHVLLPGQRAVHRRAAWHL